MGLRKFIAAAFNKIFRRGSKKSNAAGSVAEGNIKLTRQIQRVASKKGFTSYEIDSIMSVIGKHPSSKPIGLQSKEFTKRATKTLEQLQKGTFDLGKSITRFTPIKVNLLNKTARLSNSKKIVTIGKLSKDQQKIFKELVKEAEIDITKFSGSEEDFLKRSFSDENQEALGIF